MSAPILKEETTFISIFVLLLTETASEYCTQCQVMDARELSWPVESRTISLTTFSKDRWQTKNMSSGKFGKFETIRFVQLWS